MLLVVYLKRTLSHQIITLYIYGCPCTDKQAVSRTEHRNYELHNREKTVTERKLNLKQLQNTKNRHKIAEETKWGTGEVTALLSLRQFKELKISLNESHEAIKVSLQSLIQLPFYTLSEL